MYLQIFNKKRTFKINSSGVNILNTVLESADVKSKLCI